MKRSVTKSFPYCLVCLYSASAEVNKNLALQRININYITAKKDYIKYTMGIQCANIIV